MYGPPPPPQCTGFCPSPAKLKKDCPPRSGRERADQEATMPTIAIIGTLDTKGEEYAFLKEEVERRGARALVIHTGIMGEPLFAPDVGADELARLGGESLAALRTRGDRGHAVSVMAAGVAAL